MLTAIAGAEETTLDAQPLLVNTTRNDVKLGQTPEKISVISRESIQNQLAVNADPSKVLSNLLPSFSPSRQKLSNLGETLRGRKPLFLVDGVPQSNSVRDGSRAGFTIDMEMVERIEVIHGSSAEHGLGATGGIINFITRKPESGSLNQSAGVSVTSPVDYEREGLGYKLDYSASGTQGAWDYTLSGTMQTRGMFYDANGERISVNNTHGDTMDSDSYDLMAKVGYWLGDDQNLEFMVNRFVLEGQGDYQRVDGDRSAGIPATSKKGDLRGEPPSNRVTTLRLSYDNPDFYGTQLKAQVYRQQFEGVYGGGVYGLFQDPGIAPEGELFDQSENQSQKLGAKLSVQKQGVMDGWLDLSGGMDLLQDTSSQRLVQTGRKWVPETRFRNLAPFAQLVVRPASGLRVQAGTRHEVARLDVDDYRTLHYYGSQQVNGGTPSFEETLFNAGATADIGSGTQVFANYSEGFGMPDVGRVLRGIDQPDRDVDDFIDLKPIITDNRELGLRFSGTHMGVELSYFESDSDLGSRLKVIDGAYEVQRQKTAIQGVELNSHWQASQSHRLEMDYAHTGGERDTDGDGTTDTDLDGLEVPPDKLTVRWHASWTPHLSTMLQANHFFSRSFDAQGKDFDGHSLLDLSLNRAMAVGRIKAGIENLLNEDYFTYYSQAGTTWDQTYYKGRGRTLTLGYKVAF